MVQPILDGFKRLGLERDAGPGKDDENGPYFQMQRLPIHKEYLAKLVDQGLAYEAWESSEELEAMRMECESKKSPSSIDNIHIQMNNFKNERMLEEFCHSYQSPSRRNPVSMTTSKVMSCFMEGYW